MPDPKITKHIRIIIRIVVDNFSKYTGNIKSVHLRNKYNLYIADNRETKEIMGWGGGCQESEGPNCLR